MRQEDYAEKTWQDYRSILAKCIQQYEGNKIGKILDIGCGPGGFLDCCRVFGFESIGVEVSEYALSKVKAKGHEVYQTDLEKSSLPVQDCSISIVLCNKVIEHLSLASGNNLLRDCYRVLEDDGLLYITSDSRHNRYYRSHPLHVHCYTRAELHQKLKEVGFQRLIPEYVGAGLHELFPYSWNIRIRSRVSLDPPHTSHSRLILIPSRVDNVTSLALKILYRIFKVKRLEGGVHTFALK